MTWAELVRLGRELPEVREGSWYRTPSLEVRGKSFARLKEDGETVVFLLEDLGEQEHLLAARPGVFFLTDHYRGYPAILARLAKLRAGEARERLRRAWRQRAPRKLLDAPATPVRKR